MFRAKDGVREQAFALQEVRRGLVVRDLLEIRLFVA
jgi:hypothetical protein